MSAWVSVCCKPETLSPPPHTAATPFLDIHMFICSCPTIVHLANHRGFTCDLTSPTHPQHTHVLHVTPLPAVFVVLAVTLWDNSHSTRMCTSGFQHRCMRRGAMAWVTTRAHHVHSSSFPRKSRARPSLIYLNGSHRFCRCDYNRMC